LKFLKKSSLKRTAILTCTQHYNCT